MILSAGLGLAQQAVSGLGRGEGAAREGQAGLILPRLTCRVLGFPGFGYFAGLGRGLPGDWGLAEPLGLQA